MLILHQQERLTPAAFFPWKQLAENNFGIWYSDTAAVKPSTDFKTIDALKIIGYDVKDSTAAIRAFRLHFMQDTMTVLDEPAQKILLSLYKKVQ